ncbi:MAG: hypothetical protein M3014_01205 [Chloroflexota bacterium]|nr:hypothetical protein [Chloroflexota bacterium]
MILVIVPLGEAAKDKLYWLARIIMYTLASTLGAGLLALLVGSLGRSLSLLLSAVMGQWTVALLGILAVLFTLRELNIVRLPTLQLGWQVPKSWQRSSRLTGNTLYGLVLGMGIFTFIPYTGFYLLLLWELIAGATSVRSAVMIGMMYGFLRGAPAVLGGISMLRGSYPLHVNDWILSRLGWWHAVNALTLMFIGSFLLGSFFV